MCRPTGKQRRFWCQEFESLFFLVTYTNSFDTLTFSPRGAEYDKAKDDSEHIKKMGVRNKNRQTNKNNPQTKQLKSLKSKLYEPQGDCCISKLIFWLWRQFAWQRRAPSCSGVSWMWDLGWERGGNSVSATTCLPSWGHNFPRVCCRSEISPLPVVRACAGLSRNSSELHRYIGHELK